METKPHESDKWLRIIAVFKFIKTMMVASGGLVALKLVDRSTLDKLSDWIEAIPAAGAQRFAEKVLDHISGLAPHQLEALGAGAFLLAAIYLAEGIGLWLGRRWAEWLSVVATALFIPLELMELWEKASSSKALALFLNVLVVVYLIVRIVRPKQTASA